MELVQGSDLDQWAAKRQIEITDVARIGRDVARALAAAHRNGLVHRDVKPSNVLIEEASGTAKLTDFGAAKRERPSDQQLTMIGQRIGTPRYMAPEQVEGKSVDERTDLFALGATLYELLAGRPAFEGESVAAVYHAILFGEPRPLAEVRPDAPAELVDLVGRLLAKAPSDRPASGDEVAAALEALASGSLAAADDAQVDAAPTATAADAATPAMASAPPSPSAPVASAGGASPERRSSPASGTPWLMPAAGLAALLLVAAGGWWWLGSADSDGTDLADQTEDATTAEVEPVEEPSPPEQAPEDATVEVAPVESAGSAGEEVVEPEPPVSPDVALVETEPSAPEPTPASTPDAPEGAPESTAPGSDATADVPAPADAEPAGDEAPVDTAQLTPGTEAPGDAGGQPVILPPPEVQDGGVKPTVPALACPGDPFQAPGCALAAAAIQTVSADAGDGIEVTLNQPDGIYLDQEFLVVEAKAPDGLGGYLYLDVLTDAGSVYHLLPEPLHEDNTIDPGGGVRVGVEEEQQASGVRSWQVGEPFGEGYLLAVLSEKPLYEGLRPIEESLDDYREALLGSLADGSLGKTSVDVVRLEFRPRQ